MHGWQVEPWRLLVFFMEIDRGRQSYGTNLAFIGLHCVLGRCLAKSVRVQVERCSVVAGYVRMSLLVTESDDIL